MKSAYRCASDAEAEFAQSRFRASTVSRGGRTGVTAHLSNGGDPDGPLEPLDLPPESVALEADEFDGDDD